MDGAGGGGGAGVGGGKPKIDVSHLGLPPFSPPSLFFEGGGGLCAGVCFVGFPSDALYGRGGDVFSGAVSEARRDENERGGEAFFLPSHPPRASLSIDSLYPFPPPSKKA